MASTYSTSLRLELIGTGEQSGTWGTTTNTNLGTLLEQAIGGYQAIAMTDANYTLSTANGAADEARNAVLRFTGTLTAGRNVLCPDGIEKMYVVQNATTGGFAITFKTVSGTGISVANGSTLFLYVDGTNVLAVTGTLASQNGSSVTITGGSITGITDLAVADGGTGASTAADARTNLGAAASGANTDLTSVYLNNTGLKIKDTNASHGLIIAPGSDLTADRTLTITTGDSARTLTISGNVTVSQDYSTTGNPQFATIELGAATDTTLSRSAAGVLAVEGNLVPSPASQAHGDVLYRGASGWERLAAGTSGQFLKTLGAGAAPIWDAVSAGGVTITTYTSGSGNWTVPSSGTVALVRAWGGGGSGGRAASSGTGGAGGGGGGGYTEELYQLSALGSAGASIAYSVGAGGNAISSSAGNGNPGGNTTFSSGATLLTAYGGGGGTSAQLPATGGGGAGALGAGAPNTAGRLGGGASAGDPTTVWGGAGGGRSDANNPAIAYLGGGGGGGATNSAARAAGDSLQGGAGGAGVFNGTTGNAGTAPGGGGGAQGANAGSSGAGAAGRIEIWVW